MRLPQFPIISRAHLISGKTATKRASSNAIKRPSISTANSNILGALANRIVKSNNPNVKETWKSSKDRKQLEREIIEAVNAPQALRSRQNRASPADPFSSPDLPSTALGESIGDVRAGHFVLFQRNGVAHIGAILGFEQAMRNLNAVYIDSKGIVSADRLTDISFTFPGFVPHELAVRAGHNNLPGNPVELEARVEIVRKLRNMQAAMQRATVDIARKSGLLWARFKHADRSTWGQMSLDDALRFVYDSKTSFKIHHALAMKSFLQANPKHFLIDATSLLQSRMYFIRPEEQVENLDLISHWVNTGDPRIESFVKKAKTILAHSRAIASEIGSSQPEVVTHQFIEDISFSPSDLEIIKTLRFSMLRQRFLQDDPYEPYIPAITGRLGAGLAKDVGNESLCSPSVSFHVLKGLGIHTPWETLIAYGTDGTEMNRHGLAIGTLEAKSRMDADKRRVQQLLKKSAPIGARESFELDDGLDSIRHDFGSLPVYTIDEDDAHELDDGVSVERISGSDDAWIHVHIADPSSLIHPRDSLSRSAERQGLTTYFVERIFPMIPPSLTQQRFSLGSAATNGVPQPVLTFSMRIGSDGDLIDWKVRVGIVRNVCTMSYNSVDKALGAELFQFEEPLKIKKYPNPSTKSLGPESTADLHLILSASQRLRRRRLQDPRVMGWTQTHADVVVESASSLPVSESNPTAPKFYRGFPEARLLVTCPNPRAKARTMIADLMIAAGVVGARFALEHNLPFIYRVSPASTATAADIDAICATRHPVSGDVDWIAPFKHHVIFGASSYSAVRGPHATMGTEPYARCTSPLRRFLDLVNHWQIKAALRNTISSAASNSQKMGKSSQGPTMLTQEMLQMLAVEHTHLDQMNRRASKANQHTWASMTIDHALSHPNDDHVHKFMSELDAVVLGEGAFDTFNRKMYHDVWLHDLGMPASVGGFTLETMRQIGDPIKVRYTGTEFAMVPKIYGIVVDP